jgi:Tfp pilus assembly protein PilE
MKQFVSLLFIIVTLLAVTAYYEYTNTYSKLKTAKANEKALMLNNDSLKNRQRVLELTNSQLTLLSDSFANAYNKVRDSLKIKPKQVNSV